MQNGVLDAANVLINACAAEPVARDLAVKGSMIVACVGVAVKIPGGIDKRIHGVGLAQRWATTLRAPGIKKFRDFGQRRPTTQRDLVLFRDRDNSVLFAVKHGDGGTPIALP